MKKTTAFLLALILTVSLCASSLAAQMAAAWIIEPPKLTLSGFCNVPSDLGTYFTEEQRKAITVIQIDSAVPGIEGGAFKDFPNVEYLNVGEGVKYVGADIFSDKNRTVFIKGDKETLKPIFSLNNPDYKFVYDGETEQPDDTPLPRTDGMEGAKKITVPAQEPQGLPETMEKFSAVLTYLNSQNLTLEFKGTDEHGRGENSSYSYVYMITDGKDKYKLTLGMNHGGEMNQLLVVTETLDPGQAWETICRGMASLDALELPEGIRDEMEHINLRNRGRNAYAKEDGWTLNVGGVMDTRTQWNLNFF